MEIMPDKLMNCAKTNVGNDNLEDLELADRSSTYSRKPVSYRALGPIFQYAL